mmetsp:Transcript_8256/g.24827  ORF Transcript_8256/g.24827 Transcript_8256/m.24827 type:complete len:200 (-) Transcript_8256:599-1198(-)
MLYRDIAASCSIVISSACLASALSGYRAARSLYSSSAVLQISSSLWAKSSRDETSSLFSLSLSSWNCSSAFSVAMRLNSSHLTIATSSFCAGRSSSFSDLIISHTCLANTGNPSVEMSLLYDSWYNVSPSLWNFFRNCSQPSSNSCGRRILWDSPKKSKSKKSEMGVPLCFVVSVISDQIRSRSTLRSSPSLSSGVALS